MKKQEKENLKRSIQLDQKMELCHPQKIFEIEEQHRKEIIDTFIEQFRVPLSHLKIGKARGSELTIKPPK